VVINEVPYKLNYVDLTLNLTSDKSNIDRLNVKELTVENTQHPIQSNVEYNPTLNATQRRKTEHQIRTKNEPTSRIF
jgi:hypothetical protein